MTAGQQYVAFISISQLAAQPTSTYSVPYTAGDALAGGAIVFQNNGLNFARSLNSTWEKRAPRDVAFKATFNGAVQGAVPEPATWAMMIMGFGLVGATMRRRSVKVAFAA